MTLQGNRQSVLFSNVSKKKVVATFDVEGQSTEGGAVLLKSLDESLGLTSALVKHLVDARNASRVKHSYPDLFRQRVFGLALGYSDGNDAERVSHDPCLKLACDRAPLDESEDLGSQPMLSRFENSQTARSMVLMGRELEAQIIRRLSRRNPKARLVTIDFDPSCDPTHGQQQFSFFHGHYDTSCFLPQFGFLSIDQQPEQYLFHARLRPGNARCHRGLIPVLRRTIPELRRRFPKARILVRLDAGFANARVLSVLDELRVQYVVGVQSNSALKTAAEPLMERAREIGPESESSESVLGDTSYKAKTWRHSRRVVMKAEVVRHPGRTPKDNYRFIITNLKNSPAHVYALYCQRGDAENRIKELKQLDVDRTSCSRFVANQLRLVMAATAFCLYQELRWRLRRTALSRSQVGRLQLMLMKIAVRVVESCRRVVLHFPRNAPWRDVWIQAARAVGGKPA